MLDRVRKLLIEVLCEGLARVVGQNSNEHDSVVLNVGPGVVLFREKLADLRRRGLRCIWTGNRRFDNGREV